MTDHELVLDRRLTVLETQMTPALRTLTDHDERISSLERWKFWVIGAVAGAGFVGSLLGALALRALAP